MSAAGEVRARFGWGLARLPVRLMIAGVRYAPVLPVAAGERAPRLPTPRMIARGLSALERAAEGGARRLTDPDGRWRELGNKVRAFAHFRRAAEPGEIGEIFADLWRREGAGYLLGRAAAAGRGGVDPAMSRADLLPCHTGLGLGLASYHLEGLGNRPGGARLRAAVDRFLADIRRLALPGYRSAVAEALGLTVQLSHPRLLRRVDEELAGRSVRLRSFFWHGVGRGLYFDPAGMVPSRHRRWIAVERALEAPAEDARSNAVAGLVWATTLVNFCDPGIIAARLGTPLLREGGDAAVNGLASVALLWLYAVGDGPWLRAFRRHWSEPHEGAAPPAWRDPRPALEVAIDRVYPLLVEQRRIDELFRYRPVDGWAESLRADGARGAARPQEVPAHG